MKSEGWGTILYANTKICFQEQKPLSGEKAAYLNTFVHIVSKQRSAHFSSAVVLNVSFYQQSEIQIYSIVLL